MDVLVAAAREAHRKLWEHVDLASHYRRQRDDAIRQLYGSGGYSYTTLAAQVGCSRVLIAKIVQGVR